MESIVELKTNDETQQQVEFEVLLPVENNKIIRECDTDIADIDRRLNDCYAYADKLNDEIRRLTNDADWLDYTIAVSSGILTGLIDSFFVGKFDFKGAKAAANKSVNEYIMKEAKKHGYSGNRLSGAIQVMEEKYPTPQDNVWKGKGVSSPNSHHLDDFAHHPTLLGMLCSIVGYFYVRRTATMCVSAAVAL